MRFQGYLLVLWGTPIGLLGAAYLLLLVLILLLPPELPDTAARKQQRSADDLPTQTQRPLQQTGGRARTPTSSLPAADTELQEPLLSSEQGEADAEGNSEPAGSRGCGPCSGALRWLLPVLLALLCAADLSVQYALVVGAIVQDRPLLPPDVAAWIRNVVGIDDTASGTALLLALLRPTLLMAGLAMYRYVQSNAVQLRACSPPDSTLSAWHSHVMSGIALLKAGKQPHRQQQLQLS